MSAADVLSRERFFLLVFFHVFFLSSCSLESTTHVDSLESIGISAIHYITKPPFFVQNKKTFISVALTILRACNMQALALNFLLEFRASQMPFYQIIILMRISNITGGMYFSSFTTWLYVKRIPNHKNKN